MPDRDQALDYDIQRLRDLIPRWADGSIINTRLRDLDRILASYKLGPADLAFFEKEISAAHRKHTAAQVKRDEFFRSQAVRFFREVVPGKKEYPRHDD